MSIVNPAVGVDGCRAGWVAIVDNGATIRGLVVTTVTQLLDQLPDDAIIAVDIPIGLPTTGARTCDLQSRRRLGPKRGSSVFPAPIRAVLSAKDYMEACSTHMAADGRKMSRQAFAILPKIREVDTLLKGNLRARSLMREVHPEVSFAMWNAGSPLLSSKKKRLGRQEREKLIEARWPGERARVAMEIPRWQVEPDDINDAFAALWTAHRIRSGDAIGMTDELFLDEFGLPMQIVA